MPRGATAYMFITLFSILKRLFGDQQDNFIQDCVECLLMLEYNKHECNFVQFNFFLK